MSNISNRLLAISNRLHAICLIDLDNISPWEVGEVLREEANLQEEARLLSLLKLAEASYSLAHSAFVREHPVLAQRLAEGDDRAEKEADRLPRYRSLINAESAMIKARLAVGDI